jgi:TPP-dependent pyruvate/acetoin dehydrogenase alpha subunit
MNEGQLVSFEEDIAKIYENGRIKAPVHLRSGNEANLVEVFKGVSEEDYVFSTWASHLHCLLKGVPKSLVKKDILEGRSITLHYPEYKVFSSAIVGGIAPIATGVAKALSLKKGNKSRVFCFLGDMSFHTGIVNESIRYSIGHDLPITWVIEDNGKSVGTETEPTCGIKTEVLFDSLKNLKSVCGATEVDIIYYRYESHYPHSGTGVFVEF